MRKFSLIACTGVALMATTAAAGTFKTITIDDDYSDWAGVPIFAADGAGDSTGDGPDIDYVQVANDGTFLFIRTHYATANSFSSAVVIDNDSNTATGNDTFFDGTFGSEALYENDFDADQRAGFNIGTLKDPQRPAEPESGSAIISSFAESTDRELAIYLNTTFDPGVGLADLFPNDTFDLAFYSTSSDFNFADTVTPGSYTLAVPEPTAALLAVVGLTGLVGRRR